jgi:hypothetical protein
MISFLFQTTSWRALNVYTAQFRRHKISQKVSRNPRAEITIKTSVETGKPRPLLWSVILGTTGESSMIESS